MKADNARTMVRPLRYMGTKSFLQPTLLTALDSIAFDVTHLVDMFAGSATVSGWMADWCATTAADSMAFPLVFARSKILNGPDPSELLPGVIAIASAYSRRRAEQYSRQIQEETRALGEGWRSLNSLIESAPHVGNSESLEIEAHQMRESKDYGLARLYFSRGYFSSLQAIQLDSLRQAIDEVAPQELGSFEAEEIISRNCCSVRDRLLAALLSTASFISNSPGHTAQFLRSRSEASFVRVRQYWSRDVLAYFALAAQKIRPTGTADWRAQNRVLQRDALSWRGADSVPGTVFYGDPPYTKDQYSRLYHVLETLFQYDYPGSVGLGRARKDRLTSAFCYKTKALAALQALAVQTVGPRSALILSYPTGGLVDIAILQNVLSNIGTVQRLEVRTKHSTLGARHGAASKSALENIFVVQQ